MYDGLIRDATTAVNAFAAVIFFIELGAIGFSFARRVYTYRVAKQNLPAILKRGIALIGAFAVLGGETVILRYLGLTFDEGTIERLLFIVQADLILLWALGYYAKTELFDLDDPRKV